MASPKLKIILLPIKTAGIIVLSCILSCGSGPGADRTSASRLDNDKTAAAAGNVNPSPETWETEDTETLTLSEERNMKNLYASTEEYSESGSENLSADVNDFIPPEIVIFSVKGKRWSCDDLVKFTLHTDDDEDRLSWMITDS